MVKQLQHFGLCLLLLAAYFFLFWPGNLLAQTEPAAAPQTPEKQQTEILVDVQLPDVPEQGDGEQAEVTFGMEDETEKTAATPVAAEGAPVAAQGAPVAEALPAANVTAPSAKPAVVARQGLEHVPNHRIRVKSMTTLQSIRQVESIIWHPDGSSLLIDSAVGNPYYNLYAVHFDQDGNESVRPLLERRDGTAIGNLHNSNGSWHPRGRHVVFSGQNVGSTELRRSAPGYGLFSNLWLCDSTGQRSWRLTDLQSSYFNPRGASMPFFSPDGRKLVWTASDGRAGSGRARGRLDSIWGVRTLCVADFAFRGGEPEISNLKEYTPGEQDDFYESYGFTKDGKQLLFAANMTDDQPWYGMDICLFNLKTEKIVSLTDTPMAWDRYATFSPGGEKVIWSSSEGFTVSALGIGGATWQKEMVSELWIMNKDGRQKRRLTYFNQRNRPEAVTTRCYVGMSSWHPKENKVALVLHNEIRPGVMESTVMILELHEVENVPVGE